MITGTQIYNKALQDAIDAVKEHSTLTIGDVTNRRLLVAKLEALKK